jgi:hypothetical protein
MDITLGFEEIVDRFDEVLREGLQDVVDDKDAQRVALDQARALQLGMPYLPIAIGTLGGFFVGSIPSLVRDVMADEFPYVAVTNGDVSPDPEFARRDQLRTLRFDVAVHSIAYSSDLEGPEHAWRIAARLADCAHTTLISDSRTKRLIQRAPNPTRGRVSAPDRFNQQGIQSSGGWWVPVSLTYSLRVTAPPE